MEEAVTIFQSAHPNAQIHFIELDSNFGKKHYEIIGLDTSYEYEMEIDANSKEILRDNFEIDGEIESLLDFTTIIEPADAIKIASATPQVFKMSPVSWKLEANYDTQNYLIRYEKLFSETEVYINDSTGELIGVQLDD